MPADALNAEEIRAESVNLIRSLVDCIVLTLNNQDGLDIDLYGDLAGILTLATNKDKPLDMSVPSVQQVKVVAGARNHLNLLFDAPHLAHSGGGESGYPDEAPGVLAGYLLVGG